MPAMLLPTTLLHHVAPAPRAPHFDWLLVDPAYPLDERAPLCTFRVDRPWEDWLGIGRLTLTPLPPHRRRYLTWQGNLSDHRGHVRQHARALYQPQLWTPHRRLLLLHPPLPPLAPPSPPSFPCPPSRHTSTRASTDFSSTANPPRPLQVQLTRHAQHWQATLTPAPLIPPPHQAPTTTPR